jgi:hypothetical protein
MKIQIIGLKRSIFMKRVYNFIAFLFFSFSALQSQIIIDGDMSDWTGINPWDQDPANEPLDDIDAMYQPHFDLMDVYVTHDSLNLYVRIDIDPAGSFSEIFNYTNPPVFDFYMDTEIADTAGFDWGWWNIAINYYVDLATSLHPESMEKHGSLYKYNGGRIPNKEEGEFEWLNAIPVGINEDENALEFSVPRNRVNFGTEFRMFVHYVADRDSANGTDNLPDPWAENMLKYDFVDGALVYPHLGEQINSQITIDGDLSDWDPAYQADINEIAEYLGDMETGPEFDIQDVYVTSDTTYLYMRVDINPTANFSDIFTKYEYYSAIQVFLETNWGGFTGLGYGGSWKVAPDYIIDFWGILDPDTVENMTELYRYIGSYHGEDEEYEGVGVVVEAAVNEEDNVIEFAIPRSAMNVDTDVRPFCYFVGNSNWNVEDYWPNPVTIKHWEEPPYHCYNYNFITGGSVKALYDPIPLPVEKTLEIQMPDGYEMFQNYPNPFNPVTMINYQLSMIDDVELSIFNLFGQKVATLVNEQQQAGTYQVEWDASGFASGIYYYRIKAGEYQDVKKMILIK